MYYLSRRIEFSAAHRYEVPGWSPEENQRRFGVCSRPNGHGHDYKLEIMVRGDLDEKSGIVVNTTEIKNKATAFVEEQLDGKFLNDEVEYFGSRVPTTENLVRFIWDSLNGQLEGCKLHRIRLHENHYLTAEKEENSVLTLTRKYHFCAAHRLHSNHLSLEENKRLFGKCNNPHGHGHNYYLDVTVMGEPDPVTGMIMSLSELDEIVESLVLNKFDHMNLNLDTDEFKELNPTSEVVAMVIYGMLEPHIPSLYKIGLWETEKNYFEYRVKDNRYV